MNREDTAYTITRLNPCAGIFVGRASAPTGEEFRFYGNADDIIVAYEEKHDGYTLSRRVPTPEALTAAVCETIRKQTEGTPS
jgi:hypothetical protein